MQPLDINHFHLIPKIDKFNDFFFIQLFFISSYLSSNLLKTVKYELLFHIYMIVE
jgi:Kef-type K+ transport system membrane component KefB